MKKILIVIGLLLSVSASASSKSVKQQVDSLNMEEDFSVVQTTEKLYSIQTRAVPLEKRFEFLLEYSQNLSGTDFLSTNQVGAQVEYHFTNRLSVLGGFHKVSNEFTNSANSLVASQGFFPDVDFAKSRLEVMGSLNLLYGKFRITSDHTLYFDQYLRLGLARNELRSGSSIGPVGDLGFAFRYNKWGSFRIGARDYYYEEKALLTNGKNHNVHMYVQLGYLL